MKKLSETRYMQFIAAFAAALSGPVITTHIIWTSPALPILQSSNSPLGRPLTIEEASWLVSLIYLVSPPGGFLSAYIAQKFGRKISLLMGGMASMVSWIIITFAQNLATLYIGRGIGGVSMGMITAVSYIYLGEIADDDIRGMLGMLNVLVGPISSIIIFIVGPYVPYKVLALLCCALPVLYLIVFVWMPETPHFFIKKGDTEGAKRSLTKLSARNSDKRIISEKIAKLQQLICDEKSNNKITLLQFLTNWRHLKPFFLMTAALSGPAVTPHMTWISPGLPILQSPQSPLERPATDEEGSWLVSIIFILTIPGGFMGGYLAQKFGRKISMLLGGIISLVSWIIIIFAQNLVTLYIARGIAGIAFGGIAAVSYLYIGEIADDDIRGTLAMGNICFNPISSLIILTAGPYLSYTKLSLLCGAMSVPFIGLFIWMPETPLFYIMNGNVEAAKKSLIRLSPNNTDEDTINKRIVKMQERIGDHRTENKITLFHLLTIWKYLKPFLLVTVIMILTLLSGLTAIESYMQTIITTSRSSLSPEVSSIIFGVVKIPPVIVAVALCDRVGRLPLFAISAFGCAIALFGEGLYFYIQEFHEDYVDNISWLPTTALSAYMIINPIGHTSVPYVLQSELFPSESKEISSSCLQMFMGITAFAVSKTFSPLSNKLGTYTMFWFFSVVSLLSIAYIYICIPETKGKSFAEIQDKINRKKNVTINKPKSTV